MRLVQHSERLAVAAFAALLFTGCGGGHGGALTPRPGPSAPATLPPGGGLTAAQVEAALQGVQSYYQALPHASADADLQALAAHMTTSGGFASATITNGGIDATFPNGMPVEIFADHPEDLAGTFDLAAKRRPLGARAPAAARQPLSAANAHEIAFLVNESGDPAFRPSRQQAFGGAFTAAGFTAAAGYGVDVLDVTLDNIVALGNGYGIDFLDLATHGMTDKRGTYLLLSTTAITDATLQTYAADLLAQRVRVGMPLFATSIQQQSFFYTYTFAFSGDFITQHVRFNAGAIVDNQSCWGQSVNGNMGAILKAAGAGRYLGWTRPVIGDDADATDAFLIDRMLGEQAPSVTGMAQYASQRTPPQRPFPLDAIQTAMSAEARGGPIATATNGTYAQSGTDPRHLALLAETDYGGETVANPPIEYGLPSIERLVVDELNGALDVFGTFPATPGTVTVTGAQGGTTLTPTSWRTNAIVVPLPASGAGSSGLVSVTTQGISSNAVPITVWTGQIKYATHGSISAWGSDSGGGAFTLGGRFNVTLRADVHPTTVAIDTTPAPQSFAVTNAAPSSTGMLTSGSGDFTSDSSQTNLCSSCGIALGLVNPQPVMVPSAQSTNQFFVVPEGPQPPGSFAVPPAASGCNNGQPGPLNANPNTMCGFLFFTVNNPVTCTVTAGNPSYCAIVNGPLSDEVPDGNGGTAFLAPSFTLTMDPATYALSLASQPATFPLAPFGNPGNGTATIAGTFQVQSPPSDTTPASRRRH